MNETANRLDTGHQSAEPFDLLCFRVGERRYGITVLKVEGVVSIPRIRRLTGAPSEIAGIARVRDRTLAVVDLPRLLGRPASQRFTQVVMTDSDSLTLGFAIDDVEGIIRTTWGEVMPPPRGLGPRALIMGVVRDEHGLVQLLDFEQIIATIAPQAAVLADRDITPAPSDAPRVLVVDDSRLARSRVADSLKAGGWDVIAANDGAEALQWLERCDRDAPEQLQTLRVVVSDIEMPGVDGYELCRRLRGDKRFEGLRVLLHTSLSGRFDSQSVDRSGADDFLSKFDAPELARRVRKLASGPE